MIITDGLQPSDEWQTDANGKRFRYDGRCIEYEPTITTTHGTITQRQLHDMNAREKAKSASFTPPAFPSVKRCPFKTGMQTSCDGEACAWHTEGRCAQTCPHPAAGKKCPYKHTACVYDCALRPE